MKILSLSLDPQILNKESVVASRVIRYGECVALYTVIVPVAEKQSVELSPSVTVYGAGGKSKVQQFFNLWGTAFMLLKKNHYDVISSQDAYFLGVLGLMLARTFHCGLEVQVLGIEKLSFLRKLLSRFVMQQASTLRVLSERLKERLVTEFHIDEQKMLLVPIYVDVTSLGFNQSTRTIEMQEQDAVFKKNYGDRFNIVSVNRLVPIKNISMQLHAIATLKTFFPEVLLHIVGDGPLKSVIEQEVRTLHIEKNVVLQGFKSGPTLSPFFTETDCFVLTSDFEGYGMVVIEAATAGLPIVMTDVGCAGEVIINDRSGLIVAVRNDVAFTEALRRVIEDATLRERLSNEAQQAIAKLPSFDTVLKLYIQSWQKALANKL